MCGQSSLCSLVWCSLSLCSFLSCMCALSFMAVSCGGGGVMVQPLFGVIVIVSCHHGRFHGHGKQGSLGWREDRVLTIMRT